ncbi:MAG TPA: ABC transporter ATP-binding protein [Anaerolineales bacterium]
MSLETALPADVVLRVENLGKKFKFYPSQTGRFKEWLTLGRRSYHKDFHALRNVTFEVRRGEFLGIIGPNGAGKSTLLKVITGVLDKTSGAYESQGKVLSLLELSGGMDDDLTGRENVIRSAQLLGFPDSYSKERMEEIAAFAELGDFFDRPLLAYSSGMRIRLAFSLFAFLDCDILILDEVLAVGDIFFKQKCYARLEELIARETAIVLVTHSTGVVRRYCQQVLVMDQGRVIFEGETDAAIQKYYMLERNEKLRMDPRTSYLEEEDLALDFASRPAHLPGAPLTEWPDYLPPVRLAMPEKGESALASLVKLVICDSQGLPCLSFPEGEEACFYVEYLLKENIGVPVAGISLSTVHNMIVHGKDSLQHKLDAPLQVRAGSRLRFRQVIRMDLTPGNYIFNLTLSAMRPDQYARVSNMPPAELKQQLMPVLHIKPAGAVEVIPARDGTRFEQRHIGICDLPGELQFNLIQGAD